MKARGAIIACILVVMVLSALYPLRQYQSQHANVRALIAKEHALSRRISELNAQQNRLLTDDEIERIAREELGMARPGEVAFAVVPERARSSAAPRPAAGPAGSGSRSASQPGDEPWYERWWDAVSRSITGMR